MKRKNLSLIILIFLIQNIFAQNNASVNIQIKASLVRGISVVSQINTLDFGEIILSNSPITLIKSPQEGLRFKILSHPDKPVLIDYNVVQLNSNVNSSYGLRFIPKVFHTGINSEFIDPVEITSGVYYQPQNQSGEGIMNLWVGGTLQISENILHGDYSGTLVINISY